MDKIVSVQFIDLNDLNLNTQQASVLNPFRALIYDGNTVSYFDETAMTKDGSNAVAKLLDKVNGVNYLSREDDQTKQPIYQEASNSLFFNGVAHWMKSQAFTWDRPAFIYLIIKQNSWTSGRAIFDGNTALSDYMTQRTSSPNLSVGDGNEMNNPNLNVGEWGILRIKMSAGGASFQINETVPITGAFATKNPGGFTLGTFASGINKANMNVMFPIVLRKKADTSDEQQVIFEFLKKQIAKVITWNDIVSNRAKLKTFITKYNARTVDSNNQLNIVMVGDSIFGRMNGTEISDNGKATAHFPPGAWQKNIQQKLLDAYQFGTVNYYNVMAAEWTRSGAWTLNSNVDNNEFYESSTAGDYVEITVTGCTFFKLLFKDVTGSSTVGQMNVLINGSTPSALGITGVDSFYMSNTNGNYLKWNNKIWKGLSAGTSYTFRFTKAASDKSIIWGCETWTGARLNIINAGVGGQGAYNHYSEPQKFASSVYNADLILHELPLINDSYDSFHCKGGKAPNAAAISAVATDFIYATSAGTFTNYSGLVLASGEYAEYDGANWIKGSSVVNQLKSTYETYLPYLDTLKATGKDVLCFTPHQPTAQANRPWMADMLVTLRAKITSLGFPFVDLNKKYTDKSLTVATYVADGTHLNDAGVQLYVDTYKEVF